MRFLLSGLASIAVCSIAWAQAPEVVKNEVAGIQATKPAGWQHMTAAANAKNLERVDFNDPKVKEAILKSASAPLIAFIKYPEPHPDINPSFRLNIRPRGSFADRPAVEILNAVLPGILKMFSGATVVQTPKAVTVSGLPAAYARIDYTMKAEGNSFPVTSEMWIVPRGNYFFMLGAGTRQGDQAAAAEIRSIMDGLRIDPQS